MSQHDLSIANQGFPAFRSDLNDALQALGSSNSGATAPSTTYANMLWYDTANNILKIRNEDNDAWISILELNQTTDVVARVILSALKSTGTSLTVEDSSGNTIATIAQGDILVAGTSTSAGSISLAEDTDNGTNKVVLKAAASIASNLTFVLPSADGSSGQALVTDGSGNLSFASAGGDKITEGNSSVEVVDTGTGYVVTTIDGTERTRVTSNGLGINVTPLAIAGSAVQMGNNSFVGQLNVNGETYLSNNLYYDGSWKYMGNGAGTFLNCGAGQFFVYRAVSGTSGNTATLIESLKIDTSSNFGFNSGYGSVATAYGCRAWVNFGGTGTPAIRASGNVSSITDNGTGDYTINFTNSMPDANYSVGGYCLNNSGGAYIVVGNNFPPAAGSVRVGVGDINTAARDVDYVFFQIFR